jgi:Flp pilus assembly protein TadD
MANVTTAVRSTRFGPPAGSRQGLQLALFLFLLLVPLPTPAQEATGQPKVGVDELPDPSLDGLEEAVASQLRDMRQFVVQQITETELRPVQLAEPIGELGRLYLAYELTGPAERCLLLADRLAPRDFRWTYHLGYLYQGDGRLDQAARHYERALAIQPRVVPAMIRLGQVYMAQDRPEAAEWVLRDVLSKDPASAAAEATLGELLVSQKRFREGEELLLSALERQPGADRLYYPLALALRGRGEDEAARVALGKRGTVGVRPADPLIDGLAELAIGERVHLLRGRAAYQAGQFEAAAEEFRSAAEVKPDSVPARVNLGTTLGRLGDVEGAMAEYRRAIEIAPANTSALFNLGALLLQQGDLGGALEQFTAAALYAPEDGGIRFQLAEALRLNDRGEEALLHYRKAAELEPPGQMARFREAQILSAKGLHADAVARLDEGHTLAPRSSLLALTLARMLASAPDLSVRDGKRALEILQSSPIRRSVRSFETLAMAYAETGQCDKAVEWQSQAWEAALDADNQELAEGLQRMVEHYQQGPPCRYPVTTETAPQG